MTAHISQLVLWTCTCGFLLACCSAETQCYWDQDQPRNYDSLSSDKPRASSPAFELPGFRGTLTESLLDFSSEKLQELIRRGFESVSFPNVLSSWDVPVVGTVTLNLSNVLVSLTQSNYSIAVIRPNLQGGIEVYLRGLTAHATCQFRLYKSVFPALSGNAELEFNAYSIFYQFIPQASDDGNLFFVSQHPAYIANAAISVHTSHTPLAGLYNQLLSKFGKQINRIVTAEISRQISEVLPSAVNRFLAQNLRLDTLGTLGGLAFNASLAGDPRVDLNRITVVDWAQFRVWPEDVPFDCTCMRPQTWQPPTWEGQKPPMLIADIDEIAVNCLLWAYDIYNLLQHTFRSGDLQMTLQTNDWAEGVPALPLCYPNASMLFTLTTEGEDLHLSVDRDQGLVLRGSANFYFALDSTDPASLYKRLFSLGVNFENVCAKRIWLETRPLDLAPMLNVEFELMPDSITGIELYTTTVGDINKTAIQGNIEKLANSALQTWVNGQLLKNVVGLPFIPFVHFVQPNLTFHEGYLSVATDIDYYVP